MKHIILKEITRQTETKEFPTLQDKISTESKGGLGELLRSLKEGDYKIPPKTDANTKQSGWEQLLEALKDKDYKIPAENRCNFRENDTLERRLRDFFPDLNEANIRKLKGNIAENLMDTYFLHNGWKKLEGEVGINGIDGLYVKFDKDGNIKQVMIAESKYGTSQLGETQNGKQMSKEWIIAKLDKLIDSLDKNDPDYTEKIKQYEQIKAKVENDDYRTRLFRVDEKDDKLTISIQKVESKDGEIQIVEVSGAESYKINKIPQIDLKNPEDSFQTKVARDYEEAQKIAIAQEKQAMAETAKESQQNQQTLN